MEDYNKIIEALGVRFLKTGNLKVNTPFRLKNYYDVENTIILVNKGDLVLGDKEELKVGDIIFLPAGKTTDICYGKNPTAELSYEDYLNNKSTYYSVNKSSDPQQVTEPNYIYLTFEARIFDSVNFFSSLNIPPFVIKNAPKLNSLLLELQREELGNEVGKERVLKLNTERIVIEVIRYIIRENMFVEQFATNTTYFKDPRLIKLFAFIRENIEGDLSNKVLAGVANVSEDYVGQYFKTLTGINPQDYIEYQRMERAVNLLRTTKKSIRDIGKEVGYKDTAYFCRRFKMMFGIPAGKMRRRESLINV
jgi:AraC-like DNA-binding protein